MSSYGFLIGSVVAAKVIRALYLASRPKIQDRLSTESFRIGPPDDFHVHLRDGEVLEHTAAAVSRQFARALIMPNLRPPIINTDQALAYRTRIMDAIALSAPQSSFTPLMTLYLTDRTTPEEIRRAKSSGHIYACKLYPAGATTNSDSGVTDITLIYETLQTMAHLGILLLVHSEVTDQKVDIFDREYEYIKRYLKPLVKAIPNLKIVLEHVTTQEAVDFVLSCGPNVAATITAHHLLYNRNRLFLNGINPHYYCLPILKAEEHRRALLLAATGATGKFFGGTDSAPHFKVEKEACCGSAGCYTAFAAVELYAEAFDSVNCLHLLDDFLGTYGARFYGIPRNKGAGKVLLRKEWDVPRSLPFGKDCVVPLRFGERIRWTTQ